MKQLWMILFLLSIIPRALAAVVPMDLSRKMGVEGQAGYFIYLKDKADLSEASSINSKRQKGMYVVSQLKQAAEESQVGVIADLKASAAIYRPLWIINAVYVESGPEILSRIVARDDVAAVRLNRKYQILKASERSGAYRFEKSRGVEWNIKQIKADQVWNDFGVTGEGIVVCDNDTGVQWDHPALKEHYRGWNVSGRDHNYNWFDVTSSRLPVPYDDNGHGTHTTGTMVGDDGQGNQIGVAPGAKWIAVKTMDSDGNGEDLWFILSFQWILAPTDLNGENPDPTKAPHIVNNSWGFDGGDLMFYEAISALNSAGIFVEASAGNSGSGCETLLSPADYDNVFTTGAVKQSGYATEFSSRGPSTLFPQFNKPDVMAPGEDIRSCVPGNGFEGGWSGTSMAGPHTCGLAALLWSGNSELIGAVDVTREIFYQTSKYNEITECPGSSAQPYPNSVFGYGEIDAYFSVGLTATPEPEASIIFERQKYGCNDYIVLFIKDSDLIGQDHCKVRISSSTENIPEVVLLEEAYFSGTFSGYIQTETGVPAEDNILQVSEGDTVTAVYLDLQQTNGSSEVTATAHIDCSACQITDVQVSDISSTSMQVTWSTTEPGFTELWYGDTVPPDHCVRLARLETSHEVILHNLMECTDYYFLLITLDEALNQTIDDNHGEYYQARTHETVMLFSEMMSENPGWSCEGQWEWGEPQGQYGDPTSGATGPACYGYNLSGAYENNMPQYSLKTPVIDLSMAEKAVVRYSFWISVGLYPQDQASWDVSRDGGNSWITIIDNSEFSEPLTFDEWFEFTVDFTNVLAGQSQVQFRWTMGPTDSTDCYGGWNIDDFTIVEDRECGSSPSTPTPEPTAEPSPQPTKTPSLCEETGVKITMPSETFHSGDECWCHAVVCNSDDKELKDCPLFVVLDVLGSYYFAPSFRSEMDNYLKINGTFPPGQTEVIVLEPFIWPTDVGRAENIHWYAGMTDPEMTGLLGGMGTFTFGWN